MPKKPKLGLGERQIKPFNNAAQGGTLQRLFENAPDEEETKRRDRKIRKNPGVTGGTRSVRG